MKKLILFIILGLFIQAPVPAEAQILKDITKKVKKKAERKADQKIDKTIDKGFEEAEEEMKKEKEEGIKKEDDVTQDTKIEDQGQQKDTQEPTLNWAKYDFVPGDKVIFVDNLLNEENGEFPSRWDLKKGTIEVAEYAGDNVIMFRGTGSVIIPYLKNPDKDYLPDIFTMEFDLFLPEREAFTVYFYDRKNQNAPSGASYLSIRPEAMVLGPAKSSIPNKESIEGKWAHIAIAYTKGKMKAYIDETRLINIPHLNFDPIGISLEAYYANDNRRFFIKNFRLAEGGVKFYDRVMEDGKIVATGIRFDVGKATLRPESMGIINKVTQLMLEHPELKFSVEGHTDSDGSDSSNLTLSEQRAITVKNTMIKLGVSEDRLSTKGFGESVPMDTNDTPEGKANNRRVEFVKMKTIN